MPGSTPHYGLPYPVATDHLIGVDDSIQELAEDVDEMLESVVIAGRPMPAGETALTWEDYRLVQFWDLNMYVGDQFSSPDGGKTLVYYGPPRWFFIAANLTVRCAPMGGARFASYAQIYVGGVRRCQSSWDFPMVIGGDHSHSLSTVAQLSGGATIDVRALGRQMTVNRELLPEVNQTGSTALDTSLNIFPASPVL